MISFLLFYTISDSIPQEFIQWPVTFALGIVSVSDELLDFSIEPRRELCRFHKFCFDRQVLFHQLLHYILKFI